MNDTTLAELREQVESLRLASRRMEARARWWRGGAAFGLAGMLVVIAGGFRFSDVQDRVEAQRFILRDKDGKERARLGTMDSGLVYFDLLDQGGKNGIGLTLTPEGHKTVVLSDRDGSPRIGVGVHADGTPSILLSDDTKHARLGLSLDEHGHPAVALWREGKAGQGKAALRLYEDDHHLPSIDLFDSHGNPRLILGIEKETAVVSLIDDKTSRIELSVGSDGKPHFTVRDKDDKPTFVTPPPAPDQARPDEEKPKGRVD